jgi:hypothetical protein
MVRSGFSIGAELQTQISDFIERTAVLLYLVASAEAAPPEGAYGNSPAAERKNRVDARVA